MFRRLSEREEYLATQIVDIAVKVHKELGSGLLESVYEKCFAYELFERSIAYQKQKEVPIIYKNLHIDDGLRLDLLIDNLVIVELKAQENYHPVWEAQMLSYLRLTEKKTWVPDQLPCTADERRNQKIDFIITPSCLLVP